MKNVCLIITLLLMVHLNCDAATTMSGACESCLNGEPTTLQVVIRDLSRGSLSGAAADLGMFDLADALFKIEEVLEK